MVNIYSIILAQNLQDQATEKFFKSTEKMLDKKNTTTYTDKQTSYNSYHSLNSYATAASIDSLQEISTTLPKKNLHNKSDVEKAENRKKLYKTSSKCNFEFKIFIL